MTADTTQSGNSSTPRRGRKSRTRERAIVVPPKTANRAQRSTKAKAGKTAPDIQAARKPDTLRLFAKPGQSGADANGEAVVAGVAMNAFVAKEFCFGPFRELDVTACFDAMAEAAKQ